jgi:hypothetical protein
MGLMESRIKRALEGRERSGTPEIAAGSGSGNLQVNVIFTDTRGTLAALDTAEALARDLGTSIHLIVPQVVPFPYPLLHPPISVNFSEQFLSDLAWRAAQDHYEIMVHLYLCRDSLQTVLQVLEPHSLVVIGGERRWWPTGQSRMARRLRSKGHQVVWARPAARF